MNQLQHAMNMHAQHAMNCAADSPPRIGGIGDINSTAKGSGARYNAGKPDLSLVPLRFMAESIRRANKNNHNEGMKALMLLGTFQATHNTSLLYDMLNVLGIAGWHECADVFAYGKTKYAPWNWAKGMPWSVPLASTARHLERIVMYEELDDNESGLPHRGHVFCNVVMLIAYSFYYPEGNDLPAIGTLAP